MNCRDCKHWKSTEPADFTIYEIGSGYRNVGSEHRECLRVEDATEQSELRRMMIMSPDAAGLYTAPDFGCVEFEAKE